MTIHLAELRCACGGKPFSVRPGVEPICDLLLDITLARGRAPTVLCEACFAAEYPVDGNYRGVAKMRRKRPK
jgi:hypothetical protein